MATSVKITCDVCGVEKKESNHWYKPRLTQSEHTIVITAWAYSPTVPDVCGEGCLTKWIQANLYRLNPKTENETKGE